MDAEWVMVIITGVYVVATIFICWANIKSANASKEQLKEMQKQYAEANRPNIEAEFHLLKRAMYVVRLVNHGTKTAQHVKIKVEKSFIDSLSEETFKNALSRIQGRECIIGIGQYYDLFIGTNKLRINSEIKPFVGTVEYESQGVIYNAELFIDVEHYMTIYSLSTEDEDLPKSVKVISEELKEIRRALPVQDTQEPYSNDENW